MSSSRPHPEDDGGVPRVELRPVRLGKLNRPVSAPVVGQLVMPPAPPSNPPPSPPSSTPTTITPAPLAIVTSNGTVEKEGLFVCLFVFVMQTNKLLSRPLGLVGEHPNSKSLLGSSKLRVRSAAIGF